MKGSGGFNLFTPIYLCALLARNQSQILLEMGNSTVPPKNQYVLHYYCQLLCSLQRLGDWETFPQSSPFLDGAIIEYYVFLYIYFLTC